MTKQRASYIRGDVHGFRLQIIFSPCLTETDEGISATSTRHREGFNKMVEASC